MQSHAHNHEDHHHGHSHGHDHGTGHVHSHGLSLTWAFVLTAGFAAAEFAGGLISGSLALLGDAGHMVTDAVALALAALAAKVAQRPASHKWSYGLGRAEVIAALINSLFMLVIVVMIVFEAITRMQAPASVNGPIVVAVAAAGLIINIIVLMVLRRGERTLNTRGAMLHVVGDMLGSVAALVSGIVISLSGWSLIDPILSILIACLIVYSSLRLLWDTLRVIMEGVPPGIDLAEVGTKMATDARVHSVHDLHIWALSSGQIALSAHLLIADMAEWGAILETEQRLIRQTYGIEHITLQPEINRVVKVAVPDPSLPRSRVQ